jgi:hypothetical protein
MVTRLAINVKRYFVGTYLFQSKAFYEAFSWFVSLFRDATERPRAGDRNALFPSGCFPPDFPSSPDSPAGDVLLQPSDRSDSHSIPSHGLAGRAPTEALSSDRSDRTSAGLLQFAVGFLNLDEASGHCFLLNFLCDWLRDWAKRSVSVVPVLQLK